MSRILVLLPLLAGCSFAPQYLNRDIHLVAVIPTFNDTTDLDAPKVVWPLVEDAVGGRGYRSVPRSTIQDFYAKNRFGIADEIRMYRWDQLAKEWNCDALLYSKVEEYGRPLLLDAVVKVRLELVDGRTGETVWTGEGRANAGEEDDSLLGGITASLPHLAHRACARAAAGLPLPGFDPRGAKK
ncbi:MAG: DUF799 family lipoprotein [Planctomycetes bacterium]|nr:DUF799 family lipoprotein [Planctomycetota bacterium]